MSIKEFLVNQRFTLKEALPVIDANAHGLCFIVNDTNHLLGILTDGDIRRVLIKELPPSTCVTDVMNKNFTKLTTNASNEAILQTLSKKIKVIPLVDKDGVVVDFATPNRLRRIPVSEPLLDGNELAYVADCVRTTWVSSKGKYVDKFQEQFKDYCQVPHALAVSNGTVALHLALEALGIGIGDEVIVPNLTFAASINAIIYTGATPVIADIDPITLNISPTAIEELITGRTKAIMPVHLYGYPCEMDEISRIAARHNLFVVEDCAEALGSTYKGKAIGSFGDAATFSFFGNKTITTGEGGMVLFKDKAVAQKAAVLKDHGMSKTKRYWHDFVGYNYRMTNLQAALGVAQMERIEQFVQKKRAIADIYTKQFQQIEGLSLPLDSKSHYNTFWLYTIIINNEAVRIDTLMEDLLAEGVETRPIFYPLNIMPLYQPYCKNQTFPNSKLIEGKGISLPSSTNLSLKEAKFVAEKISKHLAYQLEHSIL